MVYNAQLKIFHMYLGGILNKAASFIKSFLCCRKMSAAIDEDWGLFLLFFYVFLIIFIDK